MAIPDWLFYPLFALFLAVFIAFSFFFWPGNNETQSPFSSNRDSLLLSGKQLGKMQYARGLTAELIEADGLTFLRTAAGQKPEDGVRSAGVFLPLPGKFIQNHTDAVFEMTMTLRSTGPDPSPKASIAVFSLNQSNSERITCPLGPQWSPCSVRFRPITTRQNNNVDIVGIWPDIEGLSRTADIKDITVKVIAKAIPKASK
jgi:hypothetical protein